MGSLEITLLFLATLPGLIAVAVAVWVVTTVLAQGRRLAHLEHRVHELERRGPA